MLGEGGVNIRESCSHASLPPLASFDKIQTSRLEDSMCKEELLGIRLLMRNGGH